jgi:predicted nucleic acid-binding protein
MSSSTPVSEFVADTVAFVLRLEGRKLGPAAKSAFDQAEAGGATVYVPAMALAEVLYLSEKKRIAASLADVAAYLTQFPGCKEYPLTRAVVEAAAQITDIRELHDRLIAGTARHLGRVLLTSDATLRASTFVTTDW